VKPVRVALDFDGTLADTASLVCALINYKQGTHYTPADMTSWTFWADKGYEPDFWGAFDLMDQTHLRRAIRPVSPLACSTIKYLQQEGSYEFEVVTSNHDESAKDMAAWLFGHGLDLPIKTIGRATPRQKAEMNYALYIDDAPGLAEEIAKMPKKRMVLVDQPWNRQFVCRGYDGNDIYLNGNVIRMEDWKNALTIFEAIK